MGISGIIAKLKNKHFLSLAGNAVMSVLGMITVAILYRALSLSDIGVWVFFQSTLLLVDTFRSGFITTAFIKYFSGAAQHKADAVVGSTWYIAVIITAAFIILNIPAFFFLDNISNPGLLLFFQWFSISYIATLPMFIATCIVQGEQRFDRLLIIRFVYQGLFIVLVFAFTILKMVNLQMVVYSNLAAGAVASLFVIFAGWSGIGKFSKKTKESIKELYHFGKYSVGTTLSSNLFRTSDTFIINFMLGAPALAVYNLGQRLMELIEIPLRSFAATAMPSLAAAYNGNKREEVITIMKKYTGIITVALLPVAVGGLLLADVAIYILGGAEYVHTEAANVFRLFLTFALLYPADRFLALTVDVINKPRINFIKVLIMLVVNVTCNFIGIYIFGNIYGVAIATLFPILIGVIVGYWALNNYRAFPFFSIYSHGWQESMLALQQVKHKLRRKGS
jgi:O-antigen/teichoic acid export membrane protein